MIPEKARKVKLFPYSFTCLQKKKMIGTATLALDKTDNILYSEYG